MNIFCCLKQLIYRIMNNYPLLTCHFQVEWGGSRLGFTEVSGLTIEYNAVEYRDGLSPEYNSKKMPGLVKYNNIVLKRGIIKNDNEFYNWMNTIKLNTVERRDLIISLLDEEHNPVMTWKVKNAWPVKLEGPVLKSDACEAAIETLEIAHEGITIENG
jgi:phage tail-like protein